MKKKLKELKSLIAPYPDYPKPGILFQNLNPIYGHGPSFSTLLDISHQRIKKMNTFDYIAGIESRGFILATALATHMGLGFIPVRKKGKLPGKVSAMEYQLEYGKDMIEIQHQESLKDARILIVDDVLATGGTLQASVNLLQQYTPHLAAFVLMDIQIGGRDKIKIPLETLF